MLQSSTLTCQSCGHSWNPRRGITRYRRQCPKCNSSRFEESIASTNTNVAATIQLKAPTATTEEPISTSTSKWPKIVYDLMGISDASSPENALQRAFEFYRKLLPFKHKYRLDSPEKVFEFLEKKAADGIRRAAEAEERLQNFTRDPADVFYEACADLTAVDWYEAWQKAGYAKDFLTFVNETVEKHFEGQGYELRVRERQK